MSMQDLIDAIREEQAPCFYCYNASMCHYNKLICSDYINYVQGVIPIKPSRRPSRKLYNDVWPDFVGYSVERHGE